MEKTTFQLNLAKSKHTVNKSHSTIFFFKLSPVCSCITALYNTFWISISDWSEIKTQGHDVNLD